MISWWCSQMPSSRLRTLLSSLKPSVSEQAHSSPSSWQGSMWHDGHAGTRTPLTLLLGAEPPVLVRGHGRMSLEHAISSELKSVLLRADNENLTMDGLVERIPDVFCWINWSELSDAVRVQADDFFTTDPSVATSVQRIATSICSSIAWHA
jgi:hypothetical protein